MSFVGRTVLKRPVAGLAALKAGHRYSTMGPELHGHQREVGTVTVQSSAVRSVIVQGKGSPAAAVHGQSMTRTRVPLQHFRTCDWLRVSVIDTAEKRAWSNPFWRVA